MQEHWDEFEVDVALLHREMKVHSSRDLDLLLHAHIKLFDAALEQRALLPYGPMSEELVDYLDKAVGDISPINISANTLAEKERSPPDGLYSALCCDVSDNNFVFPILDTNVELMLETMREHLPEIRARIKSFAELYETATEEIQIEAVPDELFGDIIMPQGYLIVPRSEMNIIYEVQTDYNKERLILLPHALGTISDLDNAVRYCQSFEMGGSVVIARNTEGYHLRDTALPVVKQKYSRVLGLPEPNLGIESFVVGETES